MISKILVPTDGSDTAQKAARYAIDLAAQLKCSIIVLSIVDNRSLIAQTIPAEENARRIAYANASGCKTFSVSTPVDVRRSRGEIISAVKGALDEAGIEIPFPYRTLTFKEALQTKVLDK